MSESWDWAINIFNEEDLRDLSNASQDLIENDNEGITVILTFSQLQIQEIINHYLRSRRTGNPLSMAYTEAFLASIVQTLQNGLD